MKKLTGGLILIAVILVAVLLVGGTTGIVGANPASKSELSPTVMVATPIVMLDKEAVVVIMGSGFEPEQELCLLFTTMDGVRADVGQYLDPEPVANEIGAWATAWTPGRLITKKVIGVGVYTITVTDGEYNALASAPVAFYDATKPPEELLGWAKPFVKLEE